MKGVFLQGDSLFIKNINFENISRGDVVAFNDILKDRIIVHRVVKISNKYLIVKGDNNFLCDTFPIKKSNLVGKVVSFERDGIKYKVRGGLKGLYLSKLKFLVRRLVFRSYKKITNLSFVSTIGKFILNIIYKNIIIIKLKSKEGDLKKWVFNGRAIAQRGPEKDYYYVKKPFDLIINDSSQKQEARSKK